MARELIKVRETSGDRCYLTLSVPYLCLTCALPVHVAVREERYNSRGDKKKKNGFVLYFFLCKMSPVCVCVCVYVPVVACVCVCVGCASLAVSPIHVINERLCISLLNR